MSRAVRNGFALVAIAGLLVGCSSPPAASTPASTSAASAAVASGGGTAIAVTEKEWQIGLNSTTIKAGAVTFTIANNGDKEHEFVIRKTDLLSDKLPLNADGSGTVSEDAPELTVVGDPSELGEIKSGSTDRTITVTLQPGHYVIFCNLHVEDLVHYQKGMHVDFTVQ